MRINQRMPLESIEEALISVRDHLKYLLESPSSHGREALLKSVVRRWVPLGNGDYSKIAAVDGGSNSIYFSLGEVLFIASASLFMRDTEPIRARKYQIGVLDDYYHQIRVRYCRETLEIKMLMKSLELDPEILLLDGSMLALVDRGDLATPYGYRPPYPLREIIHRVTNYIGDLASGLTSITHDLRLNEEIDRIVEDSLLDLLGMEVRRDEVRRARAFVERYEALLTLEKLLRKVISLRNVTLVGISKRSSSRAYFNERIPDMEIVRRFILENGFLEPIELRLEFPEFTGIESSYPLTLTYTKLEKGSSPLRIEILGNADIDLVRGIISSLANHSVRGYPYHLRIVHEMAKVGVDLLKHFTRNLMSPLGPVGREFLGE
ncbi:MAG: DNA double-strand break repair nuclease NurA [Candidatus Korarchaeota archaeon]|nr:DNA double-strand break repair nuclease NurA [Candidatus Korarchaeota archaeon]